MFQPLAQPVKNDALIQVLNKEELLGELVQYLDFVCSKLLRVY